MDAHRISIEDLKQIRNYFGEHDVSIFEHKAYEIMDSLVKQNALLKYGENKDVSLNISEWNSLKQKIGDLNYQGTINIEDLVDLIGKFEDKIFNTNPLY